eukprot:COSAG02_NODE_445_length_22163_cov_55.680611_14_plen_205_part_00
MAPVWKFPWSHQPVKIHVSQAGSNGEAEPLCDLLTPNISETSPGTYSDCEPYSHTSTLVELVHGAAPVHGCSAGQRGAYPGLVGPAAAASGRDLAGSRRPCCEMATPMRRGRGTPTIETPAQRGEIRPDSDPSTIVTLNVGGTKYATTLATLRSQPGSRLSTMFSGGADADSQQVRPSPPPPLCPAPPPPLLLQTAPQLLRWPH